MKDNKGSTMIEVLVGFTLLMVLMASLSSIIKVSSELMYKAKDSIKIQSEFNVNKYKKDADFSEIPGLELSLVLNEDLTSANNWALPVELKLEDAKVVMHKDSETNYKVFKIIKK